MSLKTFINQYNPDNPLEKASTPPSSWYIDERIAKLELNSVFSTSWLIAARVEQLQEKGQYVATEIAAENIVIVRGEQLKAFYNVCRHHAAQSSAHQAFGT